MALKRKAGGGRKAASISNTMPYGEVQKIWFEDLLTGVVRSLRAEEKTNQTEVVAVKYLRDLYEKLDDFTTKTVEAELCVTTRTARRYMEAIKYAQLHIDRYLRIHGLGMYIDCTNKDEIVLQDPVLDPNESNSDVTVT